MNRLKEISIIVNNGKIREVGEVEIWSLFRYIANSMKKEKPNTIIAIANGGVWLGHWLKNFFACKNYYEIEASHYSIGGVKQELIISKIPNMELKTPILIVDDVIETGDTLLGIQAEIMKKNIRLSDIITASITWKPIGSRVKPNYFGFATDQWVLYPWEFYD